MSTVTCDSFNIKYRIDASGHVSIQGLTIVFDYHFEWGAVKAASNQRKHGISFDLAATVFHDPLMISLPDQAHCETEERWITMGQADNSK